MNSAQPLPFRFTLIVRDLAALTYILPMAPDGWEDENSINWSRDSKFMGFVRKYTPQLKFVTQSATILRREWYQYGLFANVKLRIEKFDSRISVWDYSEIFFGKLDFSNCNSGRDFFAISAINLDISANITAYSSTTFEIPLDNDAVSVILPPLRYFESATWIFTVTIDAVPRFFPAMSVVSVEVNSTVASARNVINHANNAPVWATDDHYFFEAQADTFLKGSIFLRVGSLNIAGGPWYTRTSIYNNSGEEKIRLLDASDGSGFHVYRIDQQLELSVEKGERLFLYVWTDPATGGAVIGEDSQIQLSYFTQSPETIVKAFRPFDLFKKIIKKINNDVAYPCQSFYLQSIDGLLITCGDFIRRITTKTVITEKVIDGVLVTTITQVPYIPVLKTSLDDFFQSLRAVAYNSDYGTGLGIEGPNVVFEDLTYFFRTAVRICHLGNIKTYEDSPSLEYIFNSIKAGYPDQVYNSQLNGRYEINSEQIYTTPVIQAGSAKEFNLQSIYRADVYGIESIRTTETDTTNTYSDNDVFFVKAHVFAGLLYTPDIKAQFEYLNGTIAGDNLYNLDISPKRNLMRNGGFIRSALRADGYLLKFGSGKKNYDVQGVNPEGVYADEHADIEIKELPPILFYPVVVTINSSYPKNMLKLLDSYIGGYIEFTYKGNNYKGFPIDVTCDETKNSNKEFKLLLTPDNDLLSLAL